MKTIFPLLICCLVTAACNRPIIQPPGNQTPLTELHAAPNTPVISPPMQTPGNPLASTASQIDPTDSNTTTHTPSPLADRSQQLTPTPYPTPAWCPVENVTPIESGKLRIVYANPSGLWLWDEENTQKQLIKTKDIQKILLPDDGLVIAFTRLLDENHAELWAINADGSNERRLLSVDEFTELDGSTDALGVLPDGLQWEPNSHNLTFFTYPVYHALWIYEPGIPWMVNVDTGKLSTTPYQDGHMTFSPDGKYVVIYNSLDINLSNTDGSNFKEDILAPYHGIAMGESFYSPLPKWSEDSSSIMVALPDQDDLYSTDATITVWQVPVEGTPVAFGHWRAFSPSVSFSPDLTTMAYWQWPEGTANQRELHFTRLDRKTIRENADAVYILGEMVDFLAWSPDSQHFIFSMIGPGEKKRFSVGNICWRPKLALESDNFGTAAWVDDSRYLLAIQLSDFSDRWELHLGNIVQEQTDVLGVVTTYDWTILP